MQNIKIQNTKQNKKKAVSSKFKALNQEIFLKG